MGKACHKRGFYKAVGIIEALPNNLEWNYGDKVCFCLPSLNLNLNIKAYTYVHIFVQDYLIEIVGRYKNNILPTGKMLFFH